MKPILKKMLKNSVKCNFYFEKFKSINFNEVKFSEIPVTTKEELRECDPFDLIAQPISKLAQYHETSGTTGKPVCSWRTFEDLQIYADQINESEIGFREDDILFNRFPYAVSLPAHTVGKAVSDRGGCVVAASRATPIMPYTRAINLIHNLHVTCISCNVLEAFLLAEIAKRMGFAPRKDFPFLRALCVAGEMLSPQRMKRLIDVWGVPVYDFFGLTEAGNIATNCDFNAMHISNDFYCEILDSNQKVLDYGERGNLYISGLNKKGTPLVRYEVGDIAEVVKSNCSCNNISDKLIHHGRRNDMLNFNGCINTMREVQEAMLSQPQNIIGDFWKFKKTTDHLEIYVEHPKPNSMPKTIQLDLKIPHIIKYTESESLFPITPLLKSQTFTKPNYFFD